ncbi:hydrogenase 2 operon protein HybA [Magnetospirillum gryphiswaldense]|uniref:Fe-S-cluster-containing hydrogenase components 1 n=1 Tax=Magnetospirillum gryphiswaldense TaxID=55518 RepID=A4TYL8_9PROT|nr:hydrogenase 2 operon protein HybA [Magnetospirillum gryphiswaldense]AVM74675.1 Formate dehydrogenase-O iron-sulfur subunit [Magnetospirillum gryphiswaldense MSR-1]AVM78578.1 Formate dehydrogenase-O iron-sulfur subunit [Magnetospirillum gryphiswaldense]CAM75725.1 Fe-S-cluster-containing hydrogenase components 1 [Magnetospirillum gryphiswaldense MSR-1]
MSVNRRDFIKGAAGGGAALATAAVVSVPSPAQARPNLEMSPNAVGLLFDSTLCVGCKACVSGCKEANGLPADVNTSDALWDTPLDIGPKTYNVIKLYAEGTADHKDQEKDGFAFIKKSCMHCVDPSCVSVCPVSAMTKDKQTGIVGYNADICIGCRYCVASCPFGVPQSEFDTPTPKIKKCEMCRHRQAEGKIPACAEVCPTGATIFGPLTAINEEIARRRAMKAGEANVFERRTIGSGDTHERPAAQYVNHVYGETEVGGTQFRHMAGVPFDKLGYPNLREKSFASESEGIQHTLYKGLIAPAVVLGGLVWAAKRASHIDDEHPEE